MKVSILRYVYIFKKSLLCEEHFIYHFHVYGCLPECMFLCHMCEMHNGCVNCCVDPLEVKI